jgi:hypothetical protein
MAAKKKTTKGKRAVKKSAPKDATQSINPNGAIESDCIYVDGVLCRKDTGAPVK